MPANADDSPATTVRKLVELYTIEMAHLADGTIHVLLTATTVDDDEPQLLTQENGSYRVPTIDDALGVIKKGVERTSHGL
jgi:hypothetical protein